VKLECARNVKVFIMINQEEVREMNLQEAIEILKEFHDKAANYLDATSAKAFQLGIEALERIRDDRKGTFTMQLPSETD